MSYWMDNAVEPGKYILVDLGYVTSQATRGNADKLRQYVGRRNFELAAYGRLLVRVPPSKLQLCLSLFPIKTSEEHAGYCWCTHTWIEGDSGDLKYAYH